MLKYFHSHGSTLQLEEVMPDSLGPDHHTHRGTKRSASGLTVDAPTGQNEGVDDIGSEKSARLFACPYYKFDPVKHQSCLLRNTLTTTSYVRQHLLRSHNAPIHCPVCGEVKDSLVSCNEHVRLRECRPPFVPPEGLTPSQVEALKSHRGTWDDIWRVVFPQISPPPPPFVASSPVVELLDIFRSFIRSQNDVESRLIALLSDVNTENHSMTARNLALRIMEIYEDVIGEFQSLESLPIERYRSSMPSIVLRREDTAKHAKDSPLKRPWKIPRLPTPTRSEATSDTQTQAPSRDDAASSVDAMLGIERSRMLSPDTEISRSSLALPSPKDHVGGGPVGKSRIGTGLLSCSRCERTHFADQNSLTRHLREVHSRHKHPCPYHCGYSVSRKDNLKRHVDAKHRGQPLLADGDTAVPDKPLHSNATSSSLSSSSSGARGQQVVSKGDDEATGNGAIHTLSPIEEMQATIHGEEYFGWAKLEAPKPTPAPMPVISQANVSSPVDEPSPLSKQWQLARRKSPLVYNYDDCQLLPEQVRLLVLQPSTDQSADLAVELRAFSVQRLADNPDTLPYTALSYVWGTAEASKVVYVDSHETRATHDNSMGGVAAQVVGRKRLSIKPSLDAALRQLRQNERPIALWVDAICINQASVAERSDHMRLSRKIFSYASTVLVWLGPPDADQMSDQAMEFIGTVLRQTNPHEYLQPRYAAVWSHFLKLLQRPWFSRASIMQEIPLARDVVVQCGDSKTHWMDFSDAVSLFSLHFETVLSLIKGGASSAQISVDGIHGPDSIAAINVVDILPGIFHHNPDGTVYKPRQRLETLLYTSSKLKAPDPRDKAFGLFGLTTNKLQRQPDYSLTLCDVYSDVVRSVVKESQSLDIICRPWALPELKEKFDEFYPCLSGLPSWVPVWEDLSQTSVGMGSRSSFENTFVGVPGRPIYCASGDEPPKVDFRKHGRDSRKSQDEGTYRQEGLSPSQTSTMQPWQWERVRAKVRALRSQSPMTELVEGPPQDLGGSLLAWGVLLGIVTWQERMDNGMISSRILSRLSHNVRDYNLAPRELDGVPPKLWRTLVADRGPDGQNPPSWYHRACLACLAADIKGRKIDIGETIARERDSMKAHYLRRVRAVCSGRAYLECQQISDGTWEKLHGVGPADVQNGDYVCVLFGCSVPVILRPYSYGGIGEEGLPQYYKLVGEAFVLGMMNGEAMDHLREDDRMEFVLV